MSSTVLQSLARKSSEAPVGAIIVVDRPGVVEVSAASIAQALGIGEAAIASAITAGELDLRLAGEAVAWRAEDAGSALRFIAHDVVSPFSSEHRYLLSLGRGLTMETRPLVREAGGEAHVFVHTERFEENVFPGPTGGPDPRQDLFFWHALTSDAQVDVPVTLLGLEAAGASELRVQVHGATEHAAQAHRIELHWNGQSLGLFDLFGRRRHTITVSLTGVDAAEENTLTVQQHVAGEAPPVVYVDAVEVDYRRVAEAGAAAFRFGGAEEGVHTVTGLAPGAVSLYDVTDPNRSEHFGEAQADESGALSFRAEGLLRTFLIADASEVVTPTEVAPRYASSLLSTGIDADYVIIAASHLVDAVQALADHRESDGYRVLVVDVEDIFWELAHGEPDPLTIRRFLAFAWEHWETAPRFVALVGNGSLDYRDLLELGGNWVPPMLALTDAGLLPSDSMLGDVVGDDGVPEIAVGRLPITTDDELARILENVRTFESGHESLGTLFAGDDSERAEFAAAAGLLAQWAPPSRMHELDLNVEALEEARDRLLSMWNGSLSWVTYVGHGGVDRLATEGLLTSLDVAALAPMEHAPVVVGWSCNIARFDMPGYASIGEQLVVEGASAAVFSATGWSNHVDTDALRTAFSEAAFASDAETLGDAILRSHRAAENAPTQLHRVYALLGDPALRLRPPKSAPEPGSPSAGDPRQFDDPSRTGEASNGGVSGCEIGPKGKGQSPLGTWLLVLGFVIVIRRRRSPDSRHVDLH